MFSLSNDRGSSNNIISTQMNNSIKLSNQEEIEFVTRPHSDSEDLILGDYNSSNENDNDYDSKKIIPSYKRITTYTEYILKFGLHICIHISLLSILEPLLFFSYIIVIEKKMFFNQFKHFVDHMDPLISSNNELIRSELFYNLAIEFLKSEHASADEYFADLRITSEQDKELNDQNNDHLEKKALLFFFVILSITVVYYTVFQYYYRRRLFIFKILMKHLGLMVFIGLYEIWFFQTIILNYKPWSESEISYYLMQCFASHVYNYYPELRFTLTNETVTC